MTGLLRPSFRWGPLLWFGLLAAALVATEYSIVHWADFGRHPALPPAVTADLLLGLPGLFYWLLVRRYRLPLGTVVTAFGAGLAISHWLLPGNQVPMLTWAGWLAQAGEALVLLYLLGHLRRIRRAYRAARLQSADFLDNLDTAIRPVLGRLGGVLLTEVAVLRYGLLGYWAAPEVEPGQHAFSTHRQSGFGAVLATLVGLSLVELGAAHLVVAHWYPRLAWGLTAASAYSLLWLLAHGQAVRCRPVLLHSSTLVLRVGLGWRASIDAAHINDIRPLCDELSAAPDLLDAARLLLTPPNVLLTLNTPQEVRGLFGQRRLVGQLAFYVDEPAALAQGLAAARP